MIAYDNEIEQMTLTCDAVACSNEETFDGDWHECLDMAKQLGWKVRKEGGEWVHYCPDETAPYVRD